MLREKLYSLNANTKIEENFFRYYIDRVFSSKGSGTVVTGTVLGKSIKVNEKIFICDLKKDVKIKNIQVHNQDTTIANISNRTAINLSAIDTHTLKKGSLLSKKGYLRGFTSIDISFSSLEGKSLKHNQNYTIYIGSRKLEAKILLFSSIDSLENGFATIKNQSEIFCIYKEKLIIRLGNDTIAGASVINPVLDPMKKQQKLELFQSLFQDDIKLAYQILLKAHKKGLGLISSAQRFALSHKEALEFAKQVPNSFLDEENLILYPLETKGLIKNNIKTIYQKNKYALLSNNSIQLRLKWASFNFIQSVLNDLENEKFLLKDGNLYKNAFIKENFKDSLERVLLLRLEKEGISPTAPYNIYDDLDLDRKTGDDILKSLCAKKQVIRLKHNLFIYAQNLNKLVLDMQNIIKEDSYIDLINFKAKYPLSRKYLITYLDYLDNFSQIIKSNNKRIFK